MKLYILALSVILFSSIFVATCNANKLAELLAKRVAPFIVEVVGKKGAKVVRASGVMISPHGHILTTTSAVNVADKIEVRRPGLTTFESATPAMRDNGSNLTIIRIPYKKDLPFVQIKGFSPYTIGTTYLTVSFADSKTKKVAASIGKLGKKLDIMPLIGQRFIDGHGTVFPEMVPFPATCMGSAVVDEKGRFLGIANFVVSNNKKATCFLVPTRKIASFLLSLYEPEAIKVLKKYNYALEYNVGGLQEHLKEVGQNLDEKCKIAFKQEIKDEVAHYVRFDKKQQRMEAIKIATDEPKFRRLPPKGQKIHRLHRTWPYEYVKAICDYKVEIGMSPEMVKEAYGMPTKTDISLVEGHKKETWLYVHRIPGVRKPNETLYFFIDDKFMQRRMR